MRLFAFLSLCLLLAGCGSSSSSTSGPTFTNPVYRHDFADPFVLKVGKSYYAYATNTGSFTIPLLVSRDLVHWKGPTEALQTLGTWTLQGNTWAPAVAPLVSGRYAMYYTAHDISISRQCISVAFASLPTGPFRDTRSRPLVCPASLDGAIDPSPFRDRDGRLYLYWKNDGNCCGLQTHIFVQQLSADGSHLLTPRRSLAVNDQSWEGAVIEGPTMWQHDGKYYLFYSGNDYSGASYAVGYSLCTGPMGPCTESQSNPILKSRCKAAGPGGETITTDARDQTWMVYHAWLSSAVNRDPGRVLWIDRLDWKAGRPVVHGPTCSSQPRPHG